MTHLAARPDIDALKRQLMTLTTTARPSPALLSLGVPAIDQALGGGVMANGFYEIGGPAAAFLAAVLAARRPGHAIWISNRDRAARLNPFGLPDTGLAPEDLLVATAPGRDVGWAFEQALRTGAARAVIAEAASLPDFAISRRWRLAARENDVLAILLSPETTRRSQPASAADARWLAAAQPDGGFRLALKRNKKGPLGAWDVAWDGGRVNEEHGGRNEATHRFRLAN